MRDHVFLLVVLSFFVAGLVFANAWSESLHEKRQAECMEGLISDMDEVLASYRPVDKESEELLKYALVSVCIDIKEGL